MALKEDLEDKAHRAWIDFIWDELFMYSHGNRDWFKLIRKIDNKSWH